MADRYERLGVQALLPLERVWVGTRSAARLGTVRTYGGFHHLGILMEGATDAEATAIARQTAESCGIVVKDPELGMTSLALADATGTLTASRIEAALSSDHAYARSLAQFDRAVTIRYRAVLAGLGSDPDEAH